MPDIIASMIERATGREDCPAHVRQQSAEYLIDRIYGKANQPFSGKVEETIKVIEVALSGNITPGL